MRKRDAATLRLRKRLRKAEERRAGIPRLLVFDVSSPVVVQALSLQEGMRQSERLLAEAMAAHNRQRLKFGKFKGRHSGEARRVGELRDKLRQAERGRRGR